MISLFQRPLYGMLMLATAACLCGDILATEEKKPVSSEVGITILGRGPIHEAYARPTNLPYEPSPAIDKKPPDPIPEEPPNLKPEGDNVLWVPGYWSWDNIGKDWIWVSGFWRVPPPSRKWVPGHWANTEQGWQWAPGFWANADNPDIKYLEPPPASLDIGPGTPQPDADSAYVPGLWVPRENGYAWRPGYWTDIRPGWIWNGGQFVWSPTGTIYVEGYWDYPFEDRGVLFAPVSFSQPLWTNPTWCYRPSWVVGCRGLFPSLFINPSWCSYCFGNYFGSSGFQPWCTFGPRNWDPIFAHARWTNRSNPNWSANLKSQFTTIKNGEAPAPPTTISSGLVGNLSVPKGTSSVSTVKPLVTPLSQANGNGLKLTNLSSAQLAKQQNVIQQNRELSNQRTKIERSTQSLQNAGVSRSTSLKLPWAQPITAAAKTPSGSGKGRFPEIAPGVQILQSGTGAANSLPRVFKGTTDAGNHRQFNALLFDWAWHGAAADY